MNRPLAEISLPLLASPLLAIVLAGAGADRAAAQIRLGQHDGPHLAATQFNVPLEINDIASGDLDGDGRTDLVLGLNTTGFRVCFQGSGGSFLRCTDLGNYAARRVAVADVDGDSDLDVLAGGGRTAYGRPGPLELWRNDGTGALTLSPTIPTGSLIVASMEFADIDRDGDLDVVLLNESGPDPLRVWQNDGTGTFADVSAVAVAVQPGGAQRGGVVVDLDGDGHLDVVMNQWSAAHRWYRNDGAGHLAEVAGWWSGTTWTIFAAADVDGDGDADLLLGNGIHRNDGTGNVAPVGSVPGGLQPSANLLEGSAVFLDVDGDGRLEIAGAREGGRPFLWRDSGGFVFQDVSAGWCPAHTQVLRTVDYHYACSHAADLDGDGDPDLATGGTEGRGTSSTTVGVPPRLLLNLGDRFVDAARPAVPHLQHEAHDLDAGDVDGDGDLDLVLNGQTLLRQDANGAFRDEPLPTGSGGFGRARLGDVDGDGDLDLMSVGYLFAMAQPRLSRNDGTGHFTDVTATHVPALVAITASVALGDVDGDGDLDAVIGSLSPNFTGVPLRLWTNDGTGRFQDASTRLPPVLVDAAELRLADFDRDGDLDLLVGDGVFGTQAHRLLRNDGSGTFTDVTASHLPQLPVPAGPGMLVRDLDGDSDLDIGLENGTFVNDGTGAFTLVPGPAGRVLTLDLDEDGRSEHVLQGTSGIDVAGEWQPWGFSASRHDAWAFDLDGDGDEDLAVGCGLPFGSNPFYRGHVGVLFNLRRDLRFAALPRLGHECRLRLRAAGNQGAGTLAFVALATARLAVPLLLPGLGVLRLDPAAAAPLGVAVVPDPDTAVELGLHVPAVPALVGIELSAQALFVPVGNEHLGRLSAAVTHALLP